MNVGKLLKAAFKVVKQNPELVIGAVAAVKPIVRAVKAERKRQKQPA